MAKLKADFTKTPELDTDNPGESVKNSAKWTGAVAFAIFLFGIAAIAANWLRTQFSSVTGMNTDGSGLSGPWEQI